MSASGIYTGYVADKSGNIYVQMGAENRWGFSIFDDDQEFPGGFEIGEWTAIDAASVSEVERERLGWLLNS